jgi:hypothetical protein
VLPASLSNASVTRPFNAVLSRFNSIHSSFVRGPVRCTVMNSNSRPREIGRKSTKHPRLTERETRQAYRPARRSQFAVFGIFKDVGELLRVDGAHDAQHVLKDRR